MLVLHITERKLERNVRLSAMQELNWVREEKPFFYQRRRQELSSLAKETRLGEILHVRILRLALNCMTYSELAFVSGYIFVFLENF